jgi:hypothetical protein
MAGSKQIYQLDKDMLIGAKNGLRKSPFTWWPPDEYKLYAFSKFDLYPLSFLESSQGQLPKIKGRIHPC